MLALRQAALIQPLEALAHCRSRRNRKQPISRLFSSFEHQLRSAWRVKRQEPVRAAGLLSSVSRNQRNRSSTSSIESTRKFTALCLALGAEKSPSSAERLSVTGVVPSGDRMPAYWLLKSEPEEWSWEDQVKKGVESWDGVRNALAQKNMRAMKCGDQCFFYHSGKQKAVVGIVSVCKEIYPDPSDESGKWGMVDVKAVKPLVQPVTLGEMKADPIFVDLILLRQSRLSVVPLEEKHWERINELGNEKREEQPKKPRKRAKKENLTELEPEAGVPASDNGVGGGDKGVDVTDKTPTEEKAGKDDDTGRSKGRKPGKRKAVESTGPPAGVEEKGRKEKASGSKEVIKGMEKSAASTEGEASLRRSGRSKSSRS